MRDLTMIRDRYLQDQLPVRMGGLAANLARVHSFATDLANQEVVFGLLDESKHFIEWTAVEAEVETAAQLVELQVQLALWQLEWNTLWPDSERRERMATESRAWSDRVLQLSGLID